MKIAQPISRNQPSISENIKIATQIILNNFHNDAWWIKGVMPQTKNQKTQNNNNNKPQNQTRKTMGELTDDVGEGAVITEKRPVAGPGLRNVDTGFNHLL